jgi:uncharacterized protein
VPRLLWDSSALMKRYLTEVGSPTVQELFKAVPASQMVTTFWGYVETYAGLWRTHNRGYIVASRLQSALTLLEAEVLDHPDFELLSVGDAAVLDGLEHLRNHNLNTADAAILTTFQSYIQSQPPGSPQCVLVAADQRLLRAAVAEGLPTLNPEVVPAGDIPALLASY